MEFFCRLVTSLREMKADRIVGFQHDNTNPASQIASSSSASASVSASASTATRCLVCEHPDGGSAHFGSTSCLACAAFFRRTVSLNIQFVCKKDRNCVIFHELRMICRSCRFDKCITAGMKRECVQKRRSNKKIPKKHMHGLIGINFNSMNLSPNTLENAIKPFLKQEMIDIDYGNVEDGMGQMVDSPFSLKTPNSEEASPGCLSEETMAPPQILQQPKFEEVATQMPSTSSANIVTIAGILAGNFGGVVEPTNIITSIPIRPITPRSVILKQINMNGPDLLRFYVDNLNHSMDRRRMIFTETPLLAVVEDRGDVPFPSENPPPHSLKRQFQSQKFDNLLAFDFCKSCPGFDLLDRAEKVIFGIFENLNCSD
ncbi:unnamed protein product [Caenorhabditis angaria]|uniref:Nuclear receptor domain-containing protein n=1 Tax=Caenorhabditis angaria TaxID=860376 RepID=A0A9P1N3Q8_9PELO|nr:unnamed protein product [Caenorhabditis angaria]